MFKYLGAILKQPLSAREDGKPADNPRGFYENRVLA